MTAFYIKPASGDKGGSVEFTHKSFGEFLFAERLLESFEDWTRKVKRGRREEDDVSQEVMDKQIYDLLGYGGLTPEIVEYLSGLLAESSDVDVVRLFERLQDFYLRWCNGEFIDAPPEKENLPLFKKELLRKQLPERENHLGLRQVDIYAGLNVMILLFELHRYAQQRDNLKDKITFHPCGQPNTQDFDPQRLLQIIGYGQCLGVYIFNQILITFINGANFSGVNLHGVVFYGANFSGANLGGANLYGANLGDADFSGANLNGANLNGANLSTTNLSDAYLGDTSLYGAELSDANLSDANLSYADLSYANLSYADLSGANLSDANLSDANLASLIWDNNTNWANAKGLHEVVNTPSELVQQPAFSAAVSLSQGISWVIEGKVEEAIQAYNQALSLDPNLGISAQSWSILCWFGSLHGHADKVLYAGEKAVNLEPENKDYQDSRGLARALTGDLAGALDDFQIVLNTGVFNYSKNKKWQRQRWVDALKAGNNPFTPEELEELREAEG